MACVLVSRVVDEKFVKARKMKETLNNGECSQKLYIKKYY